MGCKLARCGEHHADPGGDVCGAEDAICEVEASLMYTLFMRTWDIYEIHSASQPLHGVKLRGRLRKFANTQGIDFLTENASDKENCVRFAIETGGDAQCFTNYLTSILDEVTVSKIESCIQNPVLSKMKVNNEERYEL